MKMNPKDATSPRDRMWPGSLKVIYTSNDTQWSLAEMRWRDRDGDYNDPESWFDAVGLRWNGDINNPDDKGSPRSHNQGTWTILPTPLAALARAFVAGMISEAEAEAKATLAAEAAKAA
jgi:hypothetical protein